MSLRFHFTRILGSRKGADMVRKKVWMAILAMLLGASSVSAQPMPPWGPGYPMPRYGQPAPLPMMPYGYPPAGYPMQPAPMMMPNTPYGYPAAPAPMMPPAGAMPTGPLPTHAGPGPKVGASEPYYMLPAVQSKSADETPAAPETAPGPMVHEAPIDAGPSEPYTLYEGRRYRSECKNDCTCVWFQASYIHWWVRGDSVPPLVTTGVNGSLGQLGDPGTTVLLGDSIGPKQFNGVQAMLGIWLDDQKVTSLELAGFWLGNASRQYTFSSDANGNPILSQPVQTPAEQALIVTLPGFSTGSIHVNSIMDFHSAEINLAHNIWRVKGWSFDYFGGVRYLYLNDNLSINQNITLLGGSIPFVGVPQGSGSNFLFNDVFNATNRFYGGQLGGRINWTWRNWDLGATVKFGLGATTHNVSIDGTTTLNATNGGSTTVAGSTLAQASNIGSHTSTDVSFINEVTATLGYQVTSHMRLMVGYNILYWNRVERAGNQIDRNVDFTQSPTDPRFVGKTGIAPQFPNSRTDFWAQGVNLGIEIKY